jgi:hypothetical protein
MAAATGAQQRLPGDLVTGYWLVVATVAGLAIGLLYGQRVLASGHDPNAMSLDERKRIGRSLAIRS